MKMTMTKTKTKKMRGTMKIEIKEENMGTIKVCPNLSRTSAQYY